MPSTSSSFNLLHFLIRTSIFEPVSSRSSSALLLFYSFFAYIAYTSICVRVYVYKPGLSISYADYPIEYRCSRLRPTIQVRLSVQSKVERRIESVSKRQAVQPGGTMKKKKNFFIIFSYIWRKKTLVLTETLVQSRFSSPSPWTGNVREPELRSKDQVLNHFMRGYMSENIVCPTQLREKRGGVSCHKLPISFSYPTR